MNASADITSICHLCGIKVNGPALRWNGIEITGELAAHLNNDCSYMNKYTVRINEAAI